MRLGVEVVKLLLQNDFLVHEVAVSDEVLDIGTVERRPVFQVGVMSLLLDVGTINIVHDLALDSI